MMSDPSAPQIARTAIALLWASLFFAIAPQFLTSPFDGPLLVTILVVLALYGLVVFRASRRHNWARYVLLVWTLLALGLYLEGFNEDDRPWWDHLLTVASFALELVGIYLLFTAPARHWYRREAAV